MQFVSLQEDMNTATPDGRKVDDRMLARAAARPIRPGRGSANHVRRWTCGGTLP